MSFKRLVQGLREAVQPVYVVLAQAHPLRERAMKLVREAVWPEIGPPAFNHGTFRASEPNSEEAFVAARTLPAMASRRLVEVRDLEQGSSAFFEALLGYLAKPSPDAVVVLAGASFPKVEKGGSNWGLRVKKALGKDGAGQLVQIGDREVTPARFVTRVAEQAGKTLARPAVALLVELVGTDLGRLEQEVQKLVTYVGDASEIGPEDVAEATANVAQAVSWGLTGGLTRGDPEVTLRALHRLQQGGDDARKLLGLLSWQLRELLRAAELVRAGLSDADIQRETRLRPDALRRIRRDGGRDQPDAAELLRRLATVNRFMNSHRASADRLLEGLVLELLEGRLRRPPPVPRPR